MAVLVIDKRLHSGSRRLALPSLLGDGLPERLRSTSIAMLGIVAAVGLGIVGFAFQLGFPLIASAPLPEPPAKPDASSERTVAEERPAKKAAPAPAPAARGGASTASGEADSAPVGAGSSPAAPAAPGPAGEGAVLVTGTAPVQTRPQRKQPVDPPATESPAPEATPAAPSPVEPTATSSEAPEPTPEVVPETAAATHPGNGNAYGKGNGKGVGNTVGPPGQATSEHGSAHPDE